METGWNYKKTQPSSSKKEKKKEKASNIVALTSKALSSHAITILKLNMYHHFQINLFFFSSIFGVALDPFTRVWLLTP